MLLLHHSFPFIVTGNGHDGVECVEPRLERNAFGEVEIGADEIDDEPCPLLLDVFACQCP